MPSEPDQGMHRGEILIGGVALAAGGIGTTPVPIQSEGRVPDFGPYSEPWAGATFLTDGGRAVSQLYRACAQPAE
jgi:hypothetical protein